MKYSDVHKSYNENELVMLTTIYSNTPNKCLLVKIKKDIVSFLQIVDDGTQSGCSIPLSIPYSLIKSIERVADGNILFYVDLNNYHIANAVINKSATKHNAKI